MAWWSPAPGKRSAHTEFRNCGLKPSVEAEVEGGRWRSQDLPVAYDVPSSKKDRL